MRPIDADKLLARYKLRCVDCEQTQNYCKYLCDLADVISDLEDAPTIEERKKGKWYVRDITRYGGKPYICTVCGRGANDVYHFCPSCGADMREETNDEVH